MIKFLIFIIIMGALVGFVWHDEIGVWLENWRKQAEEEGPGLINEGYQQAKNWWEEKGEAWADQFVANLTSQGKQRIDQWLAEKNLNQYGDSQGTMYTGGTPLFNESTGQSLDRYVYLLQKFPDLMKDLNLEQYLK